MNNNIIDYSQKVVEMRNITKKFGNFIANLYKFSNVYNIYCRKKNIFLLYKS